MDVLSLLIQIVLFGAVAYGVWWVCQRFGMPPPVFWLCGVALLILLFMFLARQFGINAPVLRR